MKKLLVGFLAIVLVLSSVYVARNSIFTKKEEKTTVVSKNANPKPNVIKSTKPFTPDEAQIMGIKLKMFKDEVERIVGKPLKVKKEYAGIYMADILTYYYEFGSITLEPYDENKYIVSDIEINQKNFKGVRDVHVSDEMETVLQKFPYNKNTQKDEEGVKWLYGNTETLERGSINYDENGNVEYISYNYGKSESINEYSLTFMIKNNKITHIYLGVCLEI